MTSFIKTALFLFLCIIFTTSLNKNKFRKTTQGTKVRQIIYFLVLCKNNHLQKI